LLKGIYEYDNVKFITSILAVGTVILTCNMSQHLYRPSDFTIWRNGWPILRDWEKKRKLGEQVACGVCYKRHTVFFHLVDNNLNIHIVV
jgi:hypothetical protein